METGLSSSAFLDVIDWQRPWLDAVRPAGEEVLSSPRPWREALNAAARARGLRNHRGLPLHFVPQEDLPEGKAYEAHISETGGVPTRSNLHDWFNALVWLSLPRIKVELNRLQAAEIFRNAPDGRVTSARGKLRDGATIFDENSALFVTSDSAMAEALRRHAWQELFLLSRGQWGQTISVSLFGHALMEKLVGPYKAITAHVRIVEVPASYFSQLHPARMALIDELVNSQISGGVLTQDFTPLPVLGVPGWWPDQDEEFYADQMVFRPVRRVRPQ